MDKFWMNADETEYLQMNYLKACERNTSGDPPCPFDIAKFEDRYAAALSNLFPKKTLYITQHHMAPGLLAGLSYIAKWRQMASAHGCNYTTFTVLRDPVDRLVSAYYHNDWWKRHGALGKMNHNHYPFLWRAVDNNEIRYLINNHHRSKEMLRIDKVGKVEADLAVELLKELDITTDVLCLDPLLQSLAIKAGLLGPQHAPHANEGKLRGKGTSSSSPPKALREFLGQFVEWDMDVYRRAAQLPNFMNCSDILGAAARAALSRSSKRRESGTGSDRTSSRGAVKHPRV